ncbi:MAG TPA: hypothetical protein VGH87_07820 [Polyangiaceae bacterium]
MESAKVAFTEGLAAREKNDHPGALAKFRAAYALVPTPITGLEVGRELIANGKILEGRALLLEVSRMPKKPGESEKAEQARDEAADLAEKAHAKLATLTVETDATDVSIDDVAIPKDATHTPRVLDPGHHVVVVRSANKSGRAEVDLAPGDQHQIHVDADHDDTPKPIEPPKSHIVFRPRTPFYASVVVTGAGLVVGIGAGIPAAAIAGHLASECPSKKCPPSASGDLDATLALGWVSTIGFAVAGAGAIATIITAALSTHRETAAPPPQTTVRLVPALGGFLVEGTF